MIKPKIWFEFKIISEISDLISHQEIIVTIQKFIDSQQLPHLLFYGPPGTGKTSTILAVARQLYGHKNMKAQLLRIQLYLAFKNFFIKKILNIN